MCTGADKRPVFTTDDTSTVLTPSQTHFFIWRTLSILNNFLIHSPACSALKRLSLSDRYSRLLSPPRMPEVAPGSGTTVHTSAALCNTTTIIHHYLWPPQVPAESQGTVALTQPEKGLFAGGQTIYEKRAGYFHDTCVMLLWVEAGWRTWEGHGSIWGNHTSVFKKMGELSLWQEEDAGRWEMGPSDSVGGVLWARPKPAESHRVVREHLFLKPCTSLLPCLSFLLLLRSFCA